MLILRLLYFSLKVAEVSLSESGQLVLHGLKPHTTDKYDRLIKIKGLLDSGVLTQEEFENEKRKILSEK